MCKIKRTGSRLLALAMCLIAMCCLATPAFAYADSGVAEGTEEAAVETEATESNAFTPDGNATILDEAESDQDKYFYTIQTENNNTFYIIIDKERASGNVYLLSLIDENDLMEFVTETEDTESTDTGAIPDVFTEETITPTPEPQPGEDDGGEVVDDGTDGGPNSTVLLIALVVLGAIFLGGYYIVKIRNKDTYDEDDENEAAMGMSEPEEPDDADEVEENDDVAHAADVPFSDYPDPKDFEDAE